MCGVTVNVRICMKFEHILYIEWGTSHGISSSKSFGKCVNFFQLYTISILTVIHRSLTMYHN